MKYLSIIFISLVFLSCSKEKEEEEKKDCIEVFYDQEFHAAINDEICFPNGNSFIVKNIEDAFCPCDAVCVWQGELSVLIETTINNGEKDLFRFGSESFELDRTIFPGMQLQFFTYDYTNGTLPDCQGEYDINRVTLNLTIREK